MALFGYRVRKYVCAIVELCFLVIFLLNSHVGLIYVVAEVKASIVVSTSMKLKAQKISQKS